MVRVKSSKEDVVEDDDANNDDEEEEEANDKNDEEEEGDPEGEGDGEVPLTGVEVIYDWFTKEGTMAITQPHRMMIAPTY